MKPKKSRAAVIGMLDDLIEQGVKPIDNMSSSKDNKDIQQQNPPKEHKDGTDYKTTGKPEFINPNNYLNNKEIIEYVDPDSCCLWQYKDRTAMELGNLEELAHDIKENGQIQPGIIRRCGFDQEAKVKYEVIIGERRWRACKLMGLKFAAIIKNISDTDAAIIQCTENEQRFDLSDYTKGLSYKRLIDAGILTAKDLEIRLQKSQSHIRDLLSFSRISKEIWDAIGDTSKISARTASEIARWEEKDELYRDIIISLAQEISKGAIGANKLQKAIMARTTDNNGRIFSAIEVKAQDGRHILTWRKDTNGQRSIGFPKDIREHIDFELLQKVIVKNITEQLARNTNMEGK